MLAMKRCGKVHCDLSLSGQEVCCKADSGQNKAREFIGTAAYDAP